MAQTLLEFGIAAPAEVGSHWIPCPFCVKERKRPEAQCMRVIVDPDESSWACRFCGCQGETTHGTHQLPDVAATRREYEKSAPVVTASEWKPGALNRLLRRGISEATIARCRIAFEREAWIPIYEQPMNAIAIPFYQAGKITAVHYTTSQGYSYLHGTQQAGLFGIDDVTYLQESSKTIIPQDVAYLVPDEMSKLALDTAGFSNTLALPYLPPKKDFGGYFECLDRANYKLQEDDEEGLLDRIGTIIIAAGANERLQDELVRRLGSDRCCIVRWPKLPLDHDPVTLWDDKTVVLPGDTLKDANEVLYCLGVAGLQEALRAAKPIPIDGVFTVDDFRDEFFEYYEKGLPPGIDLGYKSLIMKDGRPGYSLKTGTTTLWTGWDQSGKSRVVENFCVAAAVSEDWKFAIFSPEVLPLPLLASYFAAQWAGQPFVSGRVPRMDRERAEAAADFLAGHFFYIMTDDAPYSIDDLLERATKLVRTQGIKGLVLDPWNNIYHARKNNEREDEYIGHAIQRINAWRRKYDVWVSIVAHPTKGPPLRGQQQPIVHYHDVKGAAEWGQMVDFAISVWRDIYDEASPTQIHIQKVKFQHLATVGCALMNFDKPTARFLDAGFPFGTSVKTKQVNPQDRPPMPMPDYGTDDGAPPWMQGSDYEL